MHDTKFKVKVERAKMGDILLSAFSQWEAGSLARSTGNASGENNEQENASLPGSLFPVPAMQLFLMPLCRIRAPNEHCCTIPVALGSFGLSGRRCRTEPLPKRLDKAKGHKNLTETPTRPCPVKSKGAGSAFCHRSFGQP